MEIEKNILKLNLGFDSVKLNREEYSIQDFFELCIEHWEAKHLAAHLGCNPNTISRMFKKYFPEFTGSRMPIGAKICNLLEHKKCRDCNTIKPFDSFQKDYNRGDSLQPVCKDCRNSQQRDYYQQNKGTLNCYNAKRRAALLQRTPPWANTQAIEYFYQQCPEGHHVDHIVPLRGKYVSGLHVLENLQYLTKEENLKKSNKYEP